MGQKLGVVAREIPDAARIGMGFARQGCAVRIFTGQADLERLPAHLATVRTDIAVIAAGTDHEQEGRAAAALQQWGATLVAGDAPEGCGTHEPFDPLAGIDAGGTGGVLVLSGSFAPQSRAQVDRLADEGALVLTLHRDAVLNQDETFLMGIRSGAAATIRQGRTVVVRSENWPEAAVVTRKLAAKRWIPVDEVERRILSMLTRVCEGVVEAAGVRRVIVLGTETGAAVCRQLGITELLVLGECAPGLPALLAPGPRPLLLVLKPGTAGEPDAIVQAAAHLSALATGNTL